MVGSNFLISQQRFTFILGFQEQLLYRSPLAHWHVPHRISQLFGIELGRLVNFNERRTNVFLFFTKKEAKRVNLLSHSSRGRHKTFSSRHGLKQMIKLSKSQT